MAIDMQAAVPAPPVPGVTGSDQTGPARTYVTFDLADQTLGVDVQHVREILDRTRITRLPNASHDIEGIIDIRGESIPIVDMGTQLGMPRNTEGEETRIIVFEISVEGTSRPVGVLADRVRDVTQIYSSEISPPPHVVGAQWRGEMLRGLARHNHALILLLDLEQILGGVTATGSIDHLLM